VNGSGAAAAVAAGDGSSRHWPPARSCGGGRGLLRVGMG